MSVQMTDSTNYQVPKSCHCEWALQLTTEKLGLRKIFYVPQRLLLPERFKQSGQLNMNMNMKCFQLTKPYSFFFFLSSFLFQGR